MQQATRRLGICAGGAHHTRPRIVCACRKSPKALAKLKRQVRRTKEILSANTAAPLSVEELHGGQDFRATITRDQFETLAGTTLHVLSVPKLHWP